MEVMGEVSRGSERIIDVERKRGDCYRLLAACFYLPRKDLFAQTDLFLNLVSLLQSVCPAASVPAAALQEEVERYTEEELAVEYARLFVGPYELKAPPYGSLYIEKEGKVMGDSTMEAVRMYRDEGLSIDGDFKEVPDHITAELEFMYYLIFREVEQLGNGEAHAAAEYRGKQEAFLKKALGRWVLPFCERMQEGTENGWYRALAECLAVFVKTTSYEVPAPEAWGRR